MATATTSPPAPAPNNRLARAGCIFLFFFALKLTMSLVLFCGLFQLVSTLVTGRPHRRIALFGQSLSVYGKEVSLFVSGQTAAAPWPFADFPRVNE